MKIDIDIIFEYMDKNKIGKSAFADRCKISYTTLNKVLKRERARITTLNKIAATMGVRLLQLLIDNT